MSTTYPPPLYQREHLDLEYQSQPQPHRRGWSPCGKLCCCLILTLIAAIITIGVLIYFLVRTPSVSVDHTQLLCPNQSVCVNAALDSFIPFTVFLKVDNPNIIGADISAPIQIYDTDDITLLATGEMPQQYVAANGVTIVQADFTAQVTPQNQAGLKRVLTSLYVNKQEYQIVIHADVTVTLGALHPSINIVTRQYLQPPST